MTEAISWRRDENRSRFVSSQGHQVTGEQLENALDPFAAWLLFQVLNEESDKKGKKGK